jgi:signal transduction histidine kinase
MMQLVRISVENEMDLTLAYKKSIKAAELLGLSVSTQTTFATAVSEVCREVIDKTHDGLVVIEVQNDKDRFNLAAVITYKEDSLIGSLDGGLQYARKLVPVFHSSIINQKGTIELKLSIPRAAQVNRAKMLTVKNYFSNVEPTTAYEEVRQRNVELFQINEQSEIALKQADYINQQKNEFLSVASHELKTPLTILKAHAQMALRTNCSPETLAHINKVNIQALKMQNMIKQLLDISKIENGRADYNMELVDFNAFMQEIIDLIPHLIPNHHLIVDLGETKKVSVDKLRMEQVITNIVGNAAKYSPSGTSIKIGTKVQSDGQLVCSVKDEGIGMSPEVLDKVFDKFYRVDQIARKYNGLGMGLYISSRIIDDHGGKIWVESEERQGSVFLFSLPVQQAH